MNLSIDDELAQETFSGNDFVAKIAWQATAEKLGDPNKFDANVLHEAFLFKLQELKSIKDSYQKRCDRLEENCKDEARRHCANVRELKERFRQSMNTFNSMDNRLDAVSVKVHDLGQQLEIINRPRSEAVEACKVLKQFKEFLSASYNPIAPISVAKKETFFEDADITHKLYTISQDFPKVEPFILAKDRIEKRFNDIERELIDEFLHAYRTDDRTYMRDIANLMSNFKGFSQCVDSFIEHSLVGVIIGGSFFDHRDGFTEILNLCERIQLIATEVFKNPDEIMSKLLLNIYTGKLKDYIVESLRIYDDERYLNELHSLYGRTTNLSNQIIESKLLGSRDLDLLTQRIFSDYLNSYTKKEITALKDKCSNILNRYYESKNHQKKTTTGSSIQDLKARFRSKNLNLSGIGNINVNIGPLANINIISVASEPLPPGETFLSEEIAISILHEIKLALIRSRDLSRPTEAECAVEIFDVQIQYLCIGHLLYAIELGLSLLNSSDVKMQTDLRFLDILRQCNSIWHLIEKQFNDSFQPQISKTDSKRSYSECIVKKREMMEQLELKLNDGFEKTLNYSINYIKYILTSEQRKNDFKPENEDAVLGVSTNACSKVCKFVKMVTEKLLDCLDGENVNSGYNEFGLKFYKTIFDHLQKFEFSSIGAMIAIADVKAYSSAIKIPNRPIQNGLGSQLAGGSNGKVWPDNKQVDDMFDMLHKLCNLWVVAPENLKENFKQQLSSVPEDERVELQQKMATFAALRSDNRNSRVSIILNSFN